MVIFMGSYKGKSKKNDKEFQRVSLTEVRKSTKTDTIMSKNVDFFVDPSLDLSKLKCGDVVETSFVESDFLGGDPQLVEVVATGQNVFAEYLEHTATN